VVVVVALLEPLELLVKELEMEIQLQHKQLRKINQLLISQAPLF